MFHDLVDLIRAVIWPVTLLICLYALRNQVQAFFRQLTEALAHAAQISIGKKGLEIKLEKRITAVNSRLTAIEAIQDQVKESVLAENKRGRRGSRKPEQAARQAPGAIPQALRDLAEEYLAVQIDDYRSRLLRKNELARELGNFVVAEHVPRDLLIEEENEGLYLAAAAAVAADPTSEDLSRLLIAGAKAQRLHVRYKIVVAFMVLVSKGFVDGRSANAIHDFLGRLRIGADEPLKAILIDAETLLETIEQGEIHIGAA